MKLNFNNEGFSALGKKEPKPAPKAPEITDEQFAEMCRQRRLNQERRQRAARSRPGKLTRLTRLIRRV